MRILSKLSVLINQYRLLGMVLALLSLSNANYLLHAAQQQTSWFPQQRIPGFHPETRPPVLLADQNRTVHAFSSQIIAEDTGEPELAIMYNQWSLDNGWSEPSDILLSPIKHQARLLDAFLDQNGLMHVIFFGGDDTEANIYYANAPAASAGKASAWSEPLLVGTEALAPESGAIAGDGKGNLVVVFSGLENGPGYYATYSVDGGSTWLEASPLFLTYEEGLISYGLQMHLGESGLLHAIWNTDNIGGQGRGIYYANMRMGETQWSNPTRLAAVDSGLGTKHPAIIEHDGEVFAVYIMTPKVMMRRSSDEGKTWTEPVVLFPEHIGVNGTLSLVTDSNDDLHLFWGQRIPGNPDIHGMWHAIWQGTQWSNPDAVVSGPRVLDLVGNSGFDPFDARAVVSQGNALLVTWRTDPGNIKPNGVWYSYATLQAPELPIKPLPTVLPAYSAINESTTAETPSDPTPIPPLKPIDTDQVVSGPGESISATSPSSTLFLGIMPIVLLLVAILVRFFISYQYRR